MKISGYNSFWYFITIILFVILNFTGAYGVSTAERNALIALHNSTNGESWTYNTNWIGEEGTECSWYGITCDNNTITSVSLWRNYLTGSIPPELGNLANLTYLDLGDNQLTGSIPSELGNLANLQALYLDNNQLTGSIPPELGNLANLQALYLYYNQLTGSIPPELGNLVNLGTLYLSYNQLTGGVPPELGNLTGLELLNLSDNQLTGGFPQEFENFLYLKYLNVANNCFTDFESVSHVPNLIGTDLKADTCDLGYVGLPWLMLLLD